MTSHSARMFTSVSRRLASRSSTILLGGCYRRCLATAVGASDPKAYSATLRLPKTTLPLKHKDAVAAELVYRSRTTDELYKAQWAKNTGPLFVLHDGPPYANGHLHMGHVLNKILKDIITRYNVIRGRKVHYVPGWDCHGLPIEQKALKAIGKIHTSMSASAVRETARSTAAEAIDMQKDEFRSLAIMADWDNPEGVYITMNASFEHRQMLLFQKMVEQGHITYRLRPTYYSPSSRTALAESELKYEDGHKSRSVYVGFGVDEADMSSGLKKAYGEAVEKTGQIPLRLAVWTTTAWTLPANAGVNVGESMEYVIVKTTDHQLLIVAEARREALSDKLGALEVVARLPGADLTGTRYTHPFHPQSDSRPRPVVFPSTHVTDQSGTGLVHSAPAHGHDDYIAFSKAGLLPNELRCPIDDEGCFTAEVVDWAGSEDARDLVSQSVLGDGVGVMIELLRRQNALLAEETIEHRYPHDWKTKEPIIVRATPQWFADVEAVKPRALTALEKVNFYPPQSRNRLEAFVTSRSEWCISRQRSWGVPIPALYDEAGRPIVDEVTVSHIIKVLGEKGTDYWWTGPVEEFIPNHLEGQTLQKGTDTLDVWFDSGSSWTMLDQVRSEEPLAEVYLEGSDQHRGWFQSSLLTKLSTSHVDTQAPYGSIISHGMVMDEDGQKMSKSAGNGLSPVDVTMGTKEKPGQGADTLRIWAASVDYTRDVSIGPNAIKHASESLRKIRSAMRFLLANTSGEEIQSLPEVEPGPLELYILHDLSRLETEAIASYDVFAFNKVLNSVATFLSSTLSSFYFDAVKETLYCEAAADPKRSAIVAVLQEASQTIRKIIAPIAPHLAEELHEHAGGKGSVFLNTWTDNDSRQDLALNEDVKGLLDLRSAVNQLGEDLRSKGQIRNVDETSLTIFAEGEALRVLVRFQDDLPSIFGISTVNFGDDATVALADSEIDLATLGKVRITLSKTKKSKCPRCWKHRADVAGLCSRCATVTQS